MSNTEINKQIKEAVEVMRAGGVILYPTDTVWGIGCDSTNAEAVNKVYEIKRRVETKALIVLVDSIARVQGYVSEFPDVAWELLDVAENPLTVIYSGAKNFAPNLISDDGSVGMRITNEFFSQRLCQMMRVPVVSTSANISGDPTPQNFTEISQEVIDAVDFVVDYRREDTKKSQPSSIIKLGSSGQIQIIRK